MNLKHLKEFKRISYLYAFCKMIVSIKNRYFLPLSFSNYGYRSRTSEIRIPGTFAPNNMYLYEQTRIGDGFRLISNKGKFILKKYSVLASDCTIITQNHRSTVGIPQVFLGINHINDSEEDIVIEEDVWIGYGVTLLKGAHCSRGCICAAHSLINREIPPYAVVAGTPAKIIAVKFSKQQILRHEEALYPEEERLSEAYLDELFSHYYEGKKVFGTSTISDDDKEKMELFLSQTGYCYL
jgi:acetyltransferase-like isoleucine patch superfamily enzyme